LRQEEAAGDVVQNTFMKAWDALQKKKIPGNVKAWLYAVARNNAIDEIRHRKRTVQISETTERGSPAALAVAEASEVADPEILLQSKELVDLVWESAAGLTAAEYALLDLHLRRGFNAEELAASLRLSKGAVYTKLSRLKDSLEESVLSNLLMRQGRRHCSELNELLGRLQASRLTPAVRKAIRDHLRECPRCQESKRRYLSPAELFSALVIVPAPPGMQESIWKKVSAHIESAPPPGGATQFQARSLDPRPRFQLRLQPDLHVVAQRVGHWTALLALLRRALEAGLIQARDSPAHLEVHCRDLPSSAHLFEGGNGRDIQTLGRRPRLVERIRQRHGVTARVRGGDQLLRAGHAVGTLRPRRPRDRQLPERTASNAYDSPSALREASFPSNFSSSLCARHTSTSLRA